MHFACVSFERIGFRIIGKNDRSLGNGVGQSFQLHESEHDAIGAIAFSIAENEHRSVTNDLLYGNRS